MPATTPRGYPYPLPADPTDVAGDIERFALAVDDDTKALDYIAGPRAMAQFVGTVSNTIPGTATSGTLTWQLTDFNTLNRHPADLFGPPDTTAFQPVTGVNTTQLHANFFGIYQVMAQVQIQSSPSGAGIDMIGVELVDWTGGVLARDTTHDVTFAADGTRMIDVSTLVRIPAPAISGGNGVSLRGVLGRSSGAAGVTFLRRSITFLRMNRF